MWARPRRRLGAFYRRLAARTGKAKAVTATARKLATLFYNALRFGMTYVDPGTAYYEERYRQRVLQNSPSPGSGPRLHPRRGSRQSVSFLGKRRPSSPRRASEVRVHRGGEGHLPGHGAVSDAGGVARRVLRRPGRAPSARARADIKLGVEIAAIHAESRQRYGSPRVQAELQARGHRPSRKRVARLMRQQGLAARRRRRFRVTTDSNHARPVATNVVARQFTTAAPNATWVTDITYIWTGEGWLYLAVILDLFSRLVVGWALSARITQDLALEALGMALARRRPPQGLVHHSDRGSQYASAAYQPGSPSMASRAA